MINDATAKLLTLHRCYLIVGGDYTYDVINIKSNATISWIKSLITMIDQNALLNNITKYDEIG